MSGSLSNPLLGAITLAEHAPRIADQYDVNVAIHSDHCRTPEIDSFLKPLIDETLRRGPAGLPNLFDGRMCDGSELPIMQNLERALPLLELCRDNEIVLEVEVGVVGGEEDGASSQGGLNANFSTPADMLRVHETLRQVEAAQYMVAATFGNVHGVYKPGHVSLKPEILQQGQDVVVAKYGEGGEVLAGISRRFGQHERGNPREYPPRRRQDQHPHRHAICFHARRRGSYVQAL